MLDYTNSCSDAGRTEISRASPSAPYMMSLIHRSDWNQSCALLTHMMCSVISSKAKAVYGADKSVPQAIVQHVYISNAWNFKSHTGRDILNGILQSKAGN